LAFLILFAGYENSVHLITAATARLLTHPELAAALRAESSPHTAVVQQLVEEFLRYDQPVTTAIRRFPLQDVQVGDTVIPAGDTVLLALSAAHCEAHDEVHDAAHYEVQDADRQDKTASGGHVAFGHGPHYCLGAPLARLETRIALWTLFQRLPDLALAVPEQDLAWQTSHRQHVLTALPVTFTA
jgi:hypothetical protein